jgi:hypothetical protein
MTDDHISQIMWHPDWEPKYLATAHAIRVNVIRTHIKRIKVRRG